MRVVLVILVLLAGQLSRGQVSGDDHEIQVDLAPFLETRPLTKPCLLVEDEEYGGRTFMACELNPIDFRGETGHTLVVQGPLDLSQIVSGQTFLVAEGAVIQGYTIDIFNATRIVYESVVRSESGRPPITTTGVRTVLAIRIAGFDGVYSATAFGLHRNIFSDPVCLNTQYQRCSAGAVSFQPYVGILGNVTIENGVVSFFIKAFLSTLSIGEIQGQIFSAASAAYGSDWLSGINHVMLFFPAQVNFGGALASGNKPGKITRFRYDTTRSSSVMMHELGHNLNLAHSGKDGDPYADQTGIMGYSYLDANTLMCFNGAKSYELGWYQDATKDVSLVNETGELLIDLVGIADYSRISGGQYVVIRIDVDGVTDHFVAYNRAMGMNIETNMGANLVMVTKWVAGTGSQSMLVAQLGFRGSYTIPDYKGSGKGLKIQVMRIHRLASPSFAQVRICYNC